MGRIGTTPRRPLLSAVFISPTEPRLRAGWRLALQVVLQQVLVVVVGLILVAGFRREFSAQMGAFSTTQVILSLIGELIAITLSVFAARRLLDRRSFVSLGLEAHPAALVHFAAGVGITLVMMGLIFALESALGWLRITGFAWHTEPMANVAGSVAIFVLICVLVGWNEELMSRGYHLQTLASGLTLAWGWILSSAVFALLHLANPHASWMAVGGIVLAGLFLGYAYIRTGQLWLAMGLHTGWNFFEGVVFGFPVSGLPFYRLTRTTISGPDLWTGGEFGPEAGLILIPAIILGFALVHVFTRKRAAGGR